VGHPKGYVATDVVARARRMMGFNVMRVMSWDSFGLPAEGQAVIEGKTHDFTVNDVFVVPSWKALELNAAEDTVLFSYSDRPVQQMLGLWREARL